MGRITKFEKGQKIKSILNPLETYEILEVLKNELKVKATSKGFENLIFTCKKSLFMITKDTNKENK